MLKKKYSIFFKHLTIKNLIYLIIGVFIGISYNEYDKVQWYKIHSDLPTLNVYFTPPSGGGELIAREIYHAQDKLYIQAYSFTSKKIIEAIIAAHHRGVEIKIILDKSNIKTPYSGIKQLQQNNINVYIDKVSGIAHNKIIIIDNKKVITGSFNFSKNADKRNAENLLLINDIEISMLYIKNWNIRFQNSKLSKYKNA